MITIKVYLLNLNDDKKLYIFIGGVGSNTCLLRCHDE